MWDRKVRFVMDTISSDKVVIFSKSSCPYCKMAKDIFRELRCAYTSVDLDYMRDCDKIQDVLEFLTSARSVPRVFIEGRCVGGATDIRKMYKTGKLQKLLGM